jgi:hypothetical protein
MYKKAAVKLPITRGTMKPNGPAPGQSGPIKSAPQQIIAENTDWRFLDEAKRELKA